MQNNVTMIDELPSLEDLEVPKTPGLTMIPQTEVNKYQKFVRNSGYDPPDESGMQTNKKHNSKMNMNNIPRNNIHMNRDSIIRENMPMNRDNIMRENMYNNHRHNKVENYVHYNLNNSYNPYESEMVYERFDSSPKDYRMFKNEVNVNHSCVDVADHATSCSVCSKLYSNNNTVFILIIIFLAVVNLLLLKRILETEKS